MLTEIETHYKDLIERNIFLGELCMTWFRASSADEVIRTLNVEVLDTTMSGLKGLYAESYEEHNEGKFGGFLLLGEEPPWFLAMEYTGDRAFRALDRLSSDGEAICLIGSATLYRFALFYARDGRKLCRFDYAGDIRGETAAIEEHLQGLFHLHERYADAEAGRVPDGGLLDDWRMHAFILMERITGVRLSFEWLARGHVLYRFRV
ncbi:hypothetical protein HS048_21910 [Planomonospora sp. ID91781]|uniref:DUF6461 domain-containing protein n=1 Tax=Planomonospora sp. ID91781 TaxID=2738135 RepID=UPI0018C3903C|nr:DUF6461 domain-containing protein [Planomonospora sp. ID91781]MBG0823389.1 hypothetical protein [Planomonospora sp. ID91781]